MKSGLKEMVGRGTRLAPGSSNHCRDEKRTERLSTIISLYCHDCSNHCRDEKRTESFGAYVIKILLALVATIAAMKSGLKGCSRAAAPRNKAIVATIAAMKSGLKDAAATVDCYEHNVK